MAMSLTEHWEPIPGLWVENHVGCKSCRFVANYTRVHTGCSMCIYGPNGIVDEQEPRVYYQRQEFGDYTVEVHWPGAEYYLRYMDVVSYETRNEGTDEAELVLNRPYGVSTTVKIRRDARVKAAITLQTRTTA